MKKLFQILFVCCLAAVFAGNLFAQDKTACRVNKKSGGKYKFVKSSISNVEGTNVLFLTVKLSPEKFTDDYLSNVARRIRETYCNETIIYTEIWDSSDKRVFDDLTPAPRYSPWTKAFYSLDRKSGKEMLYFVVAGKIGDEIKINQ
jgi:hypothetical protein